MKKELAMVNYRVSLSTFTNLASLSFIKFFIMEGFSIIIADAHHNPPWHEVPDN
jgi:hypothetical protein